MVYVTYLRLIIMIGNLKLKRHKKHILIMKYQYQYNLQMIMIIL